MQKYNHVQGYVCDYYYYDFRSVICYSALNDSTHFQSESGGLIMEI